MALHDRFSWLNVAPPDITSRQAISVGRHWGIEAARAQPLYAERDANFRLDSTTGEHFLLKIASPDSTRDSIVLQNRILRFLELHAPELPISRVRADLQDNDMALLTIGGQDYFARCLSWLDGQVTRLGEAPVESKTAVGHVLAGLHLALAECPLKDAPQGLAWDLMHFAELRHLLPVADATGSRQQVKELFERYRTGLLQPLRELPKQMVHNDMNSGNILFAPGDPGVISGIIDFGDMVAAPRICDLAIACAYQLDDSDDPMAAMLPTLAAYHSRCPLTPLEASLLPALVACRLSTTLLIQGWRAEQGKDSDGDLAATSAEAARRLRAMGTTTFEMQLDRVREVCPQA